MPFKILIINPSRIVRDSIVHALGRCDDFRVISPLSSTEKGIERLASLEPDVIVIDGAVSDGGRAVCAMLEMLPSLTVVVSGVSTTDDSVIQFARAGASGYVHCDADAEEWLASIRAAIRGEVHNRKIAGVLNRFVNQLGDRGASLSSARSSLSWQVPDQVAESAGRVGLTPRERQIVALIDKGLSNKEIATNLNVEPSTIKNHVHSILAKYRVRRRTEAAARYRQLNERQAARDAESA